MIPRALHHEGQPVVRKASVVPIVCLLRSCPFQLRLPKAWHSSCCLLLRIHRPCTKLHIICACSHVCTCSGLSLSSSLPLSCRVCVQGHACVCVCGGHRTALSVVPQAVFTVSSLLQSLAGLELTKQARLAGQEAPGSASLPPCSSLHHHTWLFLTWVFGLKLRSSP